MKQAMFQDLVEHLTEGQTPRVWSLLVTIFGELAQEDRACISGGLLSRLTSLMGVKPEAVRVALHRLRKDGWIQSERQGRTSAYSLTGWGRAQSAEATPRIYDLQPLPERAWLVVFGPGHPMRESGVNGTLITSNLLITATPENEDHLFVSPILPPQPLPDWMSQKICSPETMQLTQNLNDRLNQLQGAIRNSDELDCLEISALRILIVDGWRRIILRTPRLPEHVFPVGWAGQPCRENVTTLLQAFPKQRLDDLIQVL